MKGHYVTALGGAATFGKGVARPWPQLLEAALGLPVVNLGAVGAGPDAYLHDSTVRAACAGAALTVVQLPGVQGVANPFYRVHPRRNDRFIEATPALRALYPELDFCEFSFVRHLLAALHRRDPLRFSRVARALQAAWSERMAALLADLPGPVVLLWLGDRPPQSEARMRLGLSPLLVSRPMLSALAGDRVAVVEMAAPQRSGLPGLHGPDAHEAAAAALLPVVAGRLPAHLAGPAAAPRRAAG